MHLSPFFRTMQHEAGYGQAEGNAVVAPSRGERRRRWGQAADELWARYRLPPSQAGEKGGGDRPTMGADRRRALVGRGPG